MQNIILSLSFIRRKTKIERHPCVLEWSFWTQLGWTFFDEAIKFSDAILLGATCGSKSWSYFVQFFLFSALCRL